MTIEIRDATDQDAEAMAPLMEQLMDQPSTAGQIRARMTALRATGFDHVFVAVSDGRVVGLAGLHIAWMVHTDKPTARLMSIVVDEALRGQGIGRLLVERACELSRSAGCDRIELTSRLERAGAHSFYEQVGFAHTSKRFSMALQAPAL